MRLVHYLFGFGGPGQFEREVFDKFDWPSSGLCARLREKTANVPLRSKCRQCRSAAARPFRERDVELGAFELYRRKALASIGVRQLVCPARQKYDQATGIVRQQ